MNERILIYGGYGGIGRALSQILAQKGYGLHLVGRDGNKLKEVASELSADYTIGDVTDEETFKKVVNDFRGECGGLVYAVGTINLGSIRRFKTDDFVNDFKVNSVGAALAVQAGLPLLKKNKNGAGVLLFSSVAAIQGFSLHSSVAMAKGAINGLTRSLAAELAPKIRVNAIAPSLVNTPLAASLLTNERNASAIAEAHPLKRIGEADDIASLAALLLSSEASWMTGQVISVDGGRSTLQTTP